ncbi:PAS domain S-box protein [Rhodopseudomonas palustris]|uniref:PAS domain-containing hybrid sensor histidine kinase/response regulator n=1 Tax=Rhodopseudomonas palustris TaxID=1076 RepID=UPI000E5A41FB|nr:PAS domain S-box protein [Rhodopseudomonas palustris]QLH70164.1 PAS domain S-box protein [Rhodopseudomonas palustris]RHZ97896.1 PAS domain S-box protein [Rhodopseudomonas palustris]
MTNKLSAPEQALIDRERELAEVQRIAKVGGVVVDLTAGFRNHRSPEYLAIHGLPPEAVNETHEDWVRRLHPDDRERAERQFLDLIKGTSDRYSAEYRIIRPNDGEVRWIAAEGRIDRDESGRAVRMVGAHIDITDRAIAREMLRESEQRFKAIADSAPVPIWVTRLDRTRSFANRAYCDFIGLPYEDALVFDWRSIIHPDDVAEVVRNSVAGEASLQPFVLEGRYRRADGQWRWIRSESQPRWDPAGRHIGFIGVAHDITTAKQAEIDLRNVNETLERLIAQRTAQLHSSESQLRAILETTNQYQGLLDLKGRLLYVNGTALAGIAAEPAQVLGALFWKTPWFEAAPEAASAIERAFRTARVGEIAKLDLELQLPAGTRHIDFSLRPVADTQGGVMAVLAEGIDSTERRRNEEALRQAQKMEAVGQLTGGVAHDFNNLLTIIRSAVDFLRRRDLPEERRRRYVDAISDTADRASKLTGQLLAFARRQPLSPVVFDVATQIQSIANLIRPLVGSRVEIDVDTGSGPNYAIADVGQFETALVNLAVNGRDAMNGEGRLSIALRRVDEIPPVRSQPARPGEFVAISVTDSGSGIAPTHLDVIFEPFFTTKEVGRGTGLGLSQAFGFAKQSGGEISVQSTLGEGATFTIYLPQAQAPEQTAAAQLSRVDPAGGLGHRILVVEDNVEVGKFSTELLQDLGYTIKWVKSADEALAALAEDEFAFDLVFSDVIMPGKNGVELATIIRERYPGLPVVLTSGYSSVLAENAHQGFELVQKPYSVEAISRVLRRAISERRTRPTG